MERVEPYVVPQAAAIINQARHVTQLICTVHVSEHGLMHRSCRQRGKIRQIHKRFVKAQIAIGSDLTECPNPSPVRNMRPEYESKYENFRIQIGNWGRGSAKSASFGLSRLCGCGFELWRCSNGAASVLQRDQGDEGEGASLVPEAQAVMGSQQEERGPGG